MRPRGQETPDSRQIVLLTVPERKETWRATWRHGEAPGWSRGRGSEAEV